MKVSVTSQAIAQEGHIMLSMTMVFFFMLSTMTFNYRSAPFVILCMSIMVISFIIADVHMLAYVHSSQEKDFAFFLILQLLPI